MGAKTWTFALGLKPHSLTITHPRKRKHWKRPIVGGRANKCSKALVREGHPPQT